MKNLKSILTLLLISLLMPSVTFAGRSTFLKYVPKASKVLPILFSPPVLGHFFYSPSNTHRAPLYFVQQQHFSTSNSSKAVALQYEHYLLNSKINHLEEAKVNLSFAEIGAKIPTAVYFCPSRFAISQVSSQYSREASDLRYGNDHGMGDMKPYINPTRLKKQLIKEFDAINKSTHSKIGAFSSTIATNRGNGQGWIGYRGQLKGDHDPFTILLHVRLFHETTQMQSNVLGILGSNLIYLANKVEKLDSSTFYKRLFEGLNRDLVEIDVIDFDGKNVDHLNDHLEEVLLKNSLFGFIVKNSNGKIVTPSCLTESEFNELTSNSSKYDLLSRNKNNSEAREKYLNSFKIIKTQSSNRDDLFNEFMRTTESVVDKKILTLNMKSKIRGSFIELGRPHLVYKMFKNPFPAIYKAIAYNSKSAFRDEFGFDFPGLDVNLIDILLDLEFKKINNPAKELKKFVLLKQVEEVLPQQFKGYVGIMAEKEDLSFPTKKILAFSLTSTSKKSAEEAVSNMGINLLHEIYNSDEIKSERILDEVEIDGVRVEELSVSNLLPSISFQLLLRNGPAII